MMRRRIALAVFALGLTSIITLSGCSAGSVLSSASPEASKIAELFWILLALAAVVFVVVEGLLVFSLLRFRDRSGRKEPEQVHGNMLLEIAWTLVPALILAGVFSLMLGTMSALVRESPDPLRLKVIAHQWWWEIEYPELGIVTAGELHVPVGRDVEIELSSADVIHSFWAPELFGKTDTIPGQITRVRFVASKPGTFLGRCAEFCGAQHANMGFAVIAETEEEFTDWQERMRGSRRAADADGAVEQGARAFVAKGCAGCHAIEGTAAKGKVGPSLTLFGSRKFIASLLLPNDRNNLEAWLANPQDLKPGTKMPDLGLNRGEINDIAAYLQSLR